MPEDSLVQSPRFVEPPWNLPLDEQAALDSIPENATISGMFVAPLVMEAKRLGMILPSARDRYLPFGFYPLREHARLLLETCERRFGHLPLRQALRKLGRGAPAALMTSTLGKVMLGSVDDPPQIIRAMAAAYPLNARPSRVSVPVMEPGRAIVRMEEVHYFLDSHHVGAFEGVLKFAGVRGTVLIDIRGSAAADLMLTWDV
jgi:uncharacterized protein (TIGR02265 family)